MLNDKSTQPRFYEVNGHTIYGVTSTPHSLAPCPAFAPCPACEADA